jgi:predicted GNAT superfamily acetyltransferase
LYFQHFTTTSRLVERPDGGVAAFLVGFHSRTDPEVAYIHFVGVAPDLRGHGVGAALYRAFFDTARSHGRRYVHCVTSPGNTGSRAFHARLGFAEKPFPGTGGPVHPDYDGPGLDRIVFVRDLADPAG